MYLTFYSIGACVNQLIIFCLLSLSFSLFATDFTVIQSKQILNLSALKVTNGDIENYSKGQELVLNLEKNSCAVKVTKVIRDKSYIFVNTQKCNFAKLLTNGIIVNTDDKDSFKLQKK